MPNFYAGQTDYISQLNALATSNELVDIQAGLATVNSSVTAAAASATAAAASQTAAANSASSAATQATNATAAKNAALASQTAAGTSASAAATSQTAAGTSASAAATSQTAAANSASTASTQATNASNSATTASNWATTASTHATNAGNSATTASTHATNAGNSATTAGTHATNAAASATAASNSASTASTQATNASNSATTAGTHATNAANSATTAGNHATTAGTHATSAANSATTAGTRATNAATSQTAAATSATAAATSQTAAANSASAALVSQTASANSASTASTQATNASNSATTASNWATTAGTHATNAGNSATTAGTHATNAGNSATTAGTHATNAAASATAASNSASTASTQATNASNSATTASNWATTAGTHATNAANSATAAAGYLAPVVGISVTSNTLGTGSKTFTIETGKQFAVGHNVKVSRTSAPTTTYMIGTVTSYTSGTGVIIINVTSITGSGTYTDWTITTTTIASADLTNPGPIGSATPSTGAFTTISSTGTLTIPQSIKYSLPYTEVHEIVLTPSSAIGDLDTYLDTGEGFEILTVTPIAASRNYLFVGTVYSTSAPTVEAIEFQLAVRSNTLPSLTFTLRTEVRTLAANRMLDLVTWYNATTGVVKLIVKASSTLSQGQSFAASIKALLRANYSDFTIASTAIDVTTPASGFTEAAGTQQNIFDSTNYTVNFPTYIKPDGTNTVAAITSTGLAVTGILNTSGNATLGDAEATDTHAIKGATTLLANSASAALTVTQTGTGNAFVVEDATSPDSTPFVITGTGNVVIGDSAGTVGNAGLQLFSNSAAAQNSNITANRSSTDATASVLTFNKSRGTVGVPTIVAASDAIGTLQFSGYDGAQNIVAATVKAEVDGTPGTNDMPGRLVFSTTADGASSPTERMRIDSAGNVGIGSISTAGNKLLVGGTVSGATAAYALGQNYTFQSDVTSSGTGYSSYGNTQAAAFTLPTWRHFSADQGTIGAGSVVTSQYGFIANSTIIGATNNFGFYGAIPAGANRYNLYMAGTADNYLAGKLGIGTQALSSTQVYRYHVSTDAIAYGDLSAPTVGSGSTTSFSSYQTSIATQAAVFTIPSLSHFSAAQATIGAGSVVTNQYGFVAGASLIGATTNIGFYGAIPAGANRYNFYAAGTAANYFGGETTIASASTGATLKITNTGTGNSLLVEDSTSVDSTPVVINNAGAMTVGYTANPALVGVATNFAVVGTDNNTSSMGLARFSADTDRARMVFFKSRGAVGAQGVVLSGDILGDISFSGSDGTNFIRAALIRTEVDGTPGTNDMPGRLMFETTADAGSTPIERLRIDSAGSSIFKPNGSQVVATINTVGIYITGSGNFSSGINVTGTGGFTNASNKFGVDNLTGTTRMYSSGTNSSTRGTYDFRVTDSVGTLDMSAMTLSATDLNVVGNVTAYFSDDRLKIRTGNIENALEKVNTLDTFYYTPNETAKSFGFTDKQDVALSAQQVKAVLPEVVPNAPFNNEYLTIRYERLVPLLVAAIKELSAEVEILKAQIRG